MEAGKYTNIVSTMDEIMNLSRKKVRGDRRKFSMFRLAVPNVDVLKKSMKGKT